MKKLIIGLMILLSSCGDESNMGNYKYTYRIYYPGNTITKTKTCYCHSINTGSDRGTNKVMYIKETRWTRHWVTVEKTSAPIELVNIERL